MAKKAANISIDALIQENTFLRGVIRSASDAVYAKDLKGRYLIINQAGADYFEKRIDEVIGKTDVELVGEKAGRAIMDYDVDLFKRGQAISYDTSRTFAVGERYFSTSKSPFKEENGEIIGLVGVSRDVTLTRVDEEKYKFIFENAPIAFWEEDFSDVKVYLDELKD